MSPSQFCKISIHYQSLYRLNCWKVFWDCTDSFQEGTSAPTNYDVSYITEQLKSIVTANHSELKCGVGAKKKKKNLSGKQRWKRSKNKPWKLERGRWGECEWGGREWKRWREVTKRRQWWIALILLLAFLSHFLSAVAHSSDSRPDRPRRNRLRFYRVRMGN